MNECKIGRFQRSEQHSCRISIWQGLLNDNSSSSAPANRRERSEKIADQDFINLSTIGCNNRFASDTDSPGQIHWNWPVKEIGTPVTSVYHLPYTLELKIDRSRRIEDSKDLRLIPFVGNNSGQISRRRRGGGSVGSLRNCLKNRCRECI